MCSGEICGQKKRKLLRARCERPGRAVPSSARGRPAWAKTFADVRPAVARALLFAAVPTFARTMRRLSAAGEFPGRANDRGARFQSRRSLTSAESRASPALPTEAPLSVCGRAGRFASVLAAGAKRLLPFADEPSLSPDRPSEGHRMPRVIRAPKKKIINKSETCVRTPLNPSETSCLPCTCSVRNTCSVLWTCTVGLNRQGASIPRVASLARNGFWWRTLCPPASRKLSARQSFDACLSVPCPECGITLSLQR